MNYTKPEVAVLGNAVCGDRVDHHTEERTTYYGL